MDQELAISNADGLGNVDNEENGSDSSGGAESERDTDVEGWALPATTHQMRDQLDAVASKHAKRGDQAFTKQEWQQAVHEYTAALKCMRDLQQEAALLCRRSEALCNMSKHIRSIPARTSERRALYGHDPTHLALLALKDAEKATQAKPACPELYARQGAALFLLERYSDAESSYLEGLALQPGDRTLQEGLQQVQEVLAEQEKEQQELLAEVRRTAVAAAAGAGVSGNPGSSTGAVAPAAAAGSSSPSRAYAEGPGNSEAAAVAPGGSAAKRQRRLTLSADRDDCECILCLKLLFEPVTTPCGHTFCKGCFARSMDHSNRCPMCRTVLHVSRELPVTITLQNILSKAYPSEYAARAAELAAAAGAAAAAADATAGVERLTLPLFVMSTLLPGEKMALNVFEPRYRLMVRRCMEGNRRFGMAQVGRTGPDGLDEVAVEAEITDCQLQPDGRYYLEMVGRRRIKITESWDLDGYRVASAQLMKDNPPPAAAAGGSDSGRGSRAADAGPPVERAGQQLPTAAAGDGAGGAADVTTTGAAAAGAGQGSPGVPELVDSVVTSCDSLMERLRTIMASRRVGPGQIRELFDRLGDRPPQSDAEAVSWWASRLLLLIAPSNAEGWLRRELMAETNTAARLQLLQQKLEGRLEGAGIAACTIM